jgi:hypothetical protein
VSDWSDLGLAGDPAPGSPAAFRAVATSLALHASNSRDAVPELDTASATLRQGGTGSASTDAALIAITGPKRAVLDGACVLEDAVRALAAYADALESTQARARTLLTTMDDAVAGAKFAVADALNPLHVAQLMNPWRSRDPDDVRIVVDVAAMRAQATSIEFDAATDALRARAALAGCLDQLQVLLRPTVEIDASGGVGTSGIPLPLPGPAPDAAAAARLQAQSSPPVVFSDPSSQARWWAGLSPELRAQYTALYPDTIGNTAGIPAADRDAANRVAVQRDLAAAAGRAAATGYELPTGADVTDPATADRIDTDLRRHGFTAVEAAATVSALMTAAQLRAAAAARPQDPVQLLIYQPAALDGRGRVAVSVGDVATADDVAVTVPGMTSDVPGYLDNQMGNVLELLTAADRVQAGGRTTAAVAWIGYRAPGMDPSVMTTELADVGARQFATDLSAIEGMRSPSAIGAGHTTVIAHSYGSTTASIAFDRYGARADDLVLIGSPGAGTARTVDDYEGVPPGHVWVGAASSDPVTTVAQEAQSDGGPARVGARWARENGIDPALAAGALGAATFALPSARLGRDPASAGFGARRFHAEVPDASGSFRFADHSAYYRGESGANIAAVVKGQDRSVGLAPGRPDEEHWDGRDPESDHRPPR